MLVWLQQVPKQPFHRMLYRPHICVSRAADMRAIVEVGTGKRRQYHIWKERLTYSSPETFGKLHGSAANFADPISLIVGSMQVSLCRVMIKSKSG